MDWKGLYHQVLGKGQKPVEELEVEAELGLEALKREVGQKARASRTTCKHGHPLFKEQRPEDCFDCHLVARAAQERAEQKRPPGQRQLMGAFLCLRGFHEGSAFALRLAEDVPLHVGSDPACELVLSDIQISRRHLLVVSRQGRMIVRDLNSLHHSALRARDELQWCVLDPEREYWCEDGSHLVLGEVELLYRAVDQQALTLGGNPAANVEPSSSASLSFKPSPKG